MAHSYDERHSDDSGIQKRGGYASPDRPVTSADLPQVPAGPAQGATNSSGETSSSEDAPK